ncbi:hypothetical protein BJ979_000327 [Schumannella luteola]|uniref:Uncharacterized protein n=1 Tax=Schumannella luteola TaxID=472059 RepID=A0A852Y905_9MICO|nr:hypothetical protein [Schumannella luteola]
MERRFTLALGKSHELEHGAATGQVDAILSLTFEPPTGAVLIGSVPLDYYASVAKLAE